MFDKNSYFTETVLKKTFVMCKPNVIQSCIGCAISWQPGCDVTQTKKKKGKGENKTAVVVKTNSFFNFFETVSEKVQEGLKPGGGDSDSDGSYKVDPIAEKMNADFEMG